jgi:hypothetical protein
VSAAPARGKAPRRGALQRAAFCLAASLLATAGRAASEGESRPDSSKVAPVVDSIPVKPGDRWTYRWVDDITGEAKSYQTYTLTEIKDGAFSVAVNATPIGQGQPTSGLHVYDESWNLLDDGV